MRGSYRLTGAVLVLCVCSLFTAPHYALGQEIPVKAKVTINDPQFIPLSEEQVIKKGWPWWVYVIGVAAIAGAAAAAGGGGGGGGDSGTPAPSTGSVTGSW